MFSPSALYEAVQRERILVQRIVSRGGRESQVLCVTPELTKSICSAAAASKQCQILVSCPDVLSGEPEGESPERLRTRLLNIHRPEPPIMISMTVATVETAILVVPEKQSRVNVLKDSANDHWYLTVNTMPHSVRAHQAK